MNHFLSKHLIWYPAFYFRKQKVWTSLEKYKKTQYYNRKRIRAFQFQAFKSILSFSYNNIPFYRNKYKKAAIHPEDIKKLDDIKRIPILTKQELIENKGSIYNPYYSGKKFRRSTSGSTGIPFVFYKDPKSMEIMDAIQYRNYAWINIDIGYRQARFWGHPLNKISNTKIKIIDWLINRRRLSPFHLDEKTFQLNIKKIENFKAQYLYGYAQSIFQFSQYYYNKKIDLSYLGLKGIILTGEMIFPNQIKMVKSVFGCEVVEEYGCTEIGIIGFKCGFGNMHLMENLLVESIREKTDIGAGNVVVSELYGELFPFIRYQIGDRGNVSTKECECGRELPILENLSGRKDDFIRCPNGKLTDPYVLEYIIDNMPKKYGAILQFRIIQKKIDLLEVIFVAENVSGNIKNYIIHEFKTHLSDDMNVNIDFIPEFGKDPSGKIRCFVSEI